MPTKNDRSRLGNEAREDAREQGNVARLPVRLRRAVPVERAQLPHEAYAEHPEFPLERICTHRFEPFQLRFARQAQQLFREPDDLELVASHRGLTIRGETEGAIGAAVQLLRDAYGTQMSVSPPTIRYHIGATVEQPWMGLRVRCAAERLEAVRADLFARDATIVKSEVHSGEAVVQALAPLSCLIGYTAVLEKLAGGSAQHVMWLSHYAPVPPGFPDGTAA